MEGVRKQPPVANPMANTVDSITHHKFQTDRTEIVEREQMRQIQDRGTQNYRQQRDPDLQMDLQSNLQLNLQVDLQKDLQVSLQMDLQANLQARTGLGATTILSFGVISGRDFN